MASLSSYVKFNFVYFAIEGSGGRQNWGETRVLWSNQIKLSIIKKQASHFDLFRKIFPKMARPTGSDHLKLTKFFKNMHFLSEFQKN